MMACEIEDIPEDLYEEQPKYINENYRNAQRKNHGYIY
jgi:hypothetical protein